MTTISSPLDKSDADGLPIFNRSVLGQMSGVVRQLSRAEFLTWTAAERGRINANGSGISQNGDRVQILDEPVERIWSIGVDADSSNAAKVRFPNGATLTLGHESFVVSLTTGAPTDVQPDGNMKWDQATGLYYISALSQWSVGQQLPGTGSGAGAPSLGFLSGAITTGGAVLSLLVGSDPAPSTFVSIKVGAGDAIDVLQSTDDGATFTAIVSNVMADATYSFNLFGEGVQKVKLVKVSGSGTSLYASGPYIAQPTALKGRARRLYLDYPGRSLTLADTAFDLLTATSAGNTIMVMPKMATMGYVRDALNPIELMFTFYNEGLGALQVNSAQATPGTNDVAFDWRGLPPGTWDKDTGPVSIISNGVDSYVRL